jgi:hypothetical protein
LIQRKLERWPWNVCFFWAFRPGCSRELRKTPSKPISGVHIYIYVYIYTIYIYIYNNIYILGRSTFLKTRTGIAICHRSPTAATFACVIYSSWSPEPLKIHWFIYGESMVNNWNNNTLVNWLL